MKLSTVLSSFFSFFFCMYFMSQPLCAQEEKKGRFADQVIVGSALSVIPNSAGFNNDLKHLEISWVTNASLRLTKVFHLGVEYRYIRTSGSTTFIFPPPPTSYNMYGIFTQLDILNYNGLRFFGQVSYNQGNHCGCIKFRDPFKVEGLQYIGWGAGVNYRIHKNVSIDGSFAYDYVLNPGNYNPYASGYWALGINYDLDRTLNQK